MLRTSAANQELPNMNPDAARLIRDALEDVQNGVRTLDPVTEIDIVLTAAGYMIVPMRPTAAMVERMRECARLQTMTPNLGAHVFSFLGTWSKRSP